MSCKKDNPAEGPLNIAIIQDTTITNTSVASASIIFVQKTLKYFKNNTITANNRNSEIILLGSGFSGVYDHELDGVVITGNKITWTTSNKPSTNCEVFNNIFYTKHKVPNIYIDQASLTGLKCDYNLYWCEDREPVINYNETLFTFTQWQEMGFDMHSIVINPKFVDFKTLIPSIVLNYGKNLGSEWQNGLSSTTQWNNTDFVMKGQNAVWQVGGICEMRFCFKYFYLPSNNNVHQ